MAPMPSISITELRILDGPNLYFTRPAVKLTLNVTPWLALSDQRTAELADRTGFSRASQPGTPGSEQRRRFVARLAVHLVRALAEVAEARLAVRGRPGPEAGEIVIAFPWRRRGTAEAFARCVPDLLEHALDGRRSLPLALANAAEVIAGADPGAAPTLAMPTMPVVAVTGTNGKTTTVRLIAHLARAAGRHVAYTTTDGVYRDGELVEAGDYSGFGGAAMALVQPGVDFAVLETARGGILLRGIGTDHNDVAVVTNVSADHLGLQGIHTLDQLAEVKATITRITRPQGWAVLNADDPRVLAMRRGASGQPWLFSLDPEHPALRSTVAEGGRALTVLDGALVLIAPRRHVHRLLPTIDIPVALAGISSNNLSNAMAAAAAALGAGIPEEAVVEGLRTFVLDPERNPGRANIFEIDERAVIVDYAHNEEGMRGLVEICRGLRAPGSRVFLAFAAAGDRTPAIMHRLGYTAARGADQVVISQLSRYLRGRDPMEVVRLLQDGIIDAGKPEAPVFDSELQSLQWMLRESTSGDVIAVTALSQRPEIFAHLRERGGTFAPPDRIKALVQRARG